MVRGPQNPAIGCVSWQIGFLHAAMWFLGPVERTAGALGYRAPWLPKPVILRAPAHLENLKTQAARFPTGPRTRSIGSCRIDHPRPLVDRPRPDIENGGRRSRANVHCFFNRQSFARGNSVAHGPCDPSQQAKKSQRSAGAPLEARDTRDHWPTRSVLGPRCDTAQPDRLRNGFERASRTPWVDGGLIGRAPPPVLLNGTYHEREIRPLSIDNSDPRQLTEADFEIGCVGIVQLQA